MCPLHVAVVTVLHVGVVIFIIIAGLTQAKGSNMTTGGCVPTLSGVQAFLASQSLSAQVVLHRLLVKCHIASVT